MRFITTLIVAVVAFALSEMFLPEIFWLKVVVLSIGALVFSKNAFKKIDNTPPSKGVLAIFGRRLNVELKEGWHFFPIHPFIFSYVAVNVEMVVQDLEPQEVRTPDKTQVAVETSIAWIPGIEGEGESLNTYINKGGEIGVRKSLRNGIEDRTRTWAASNDEGPADWEEAQALKGDAHEVLVKAILRESLTEIDSPIPTTAWLRFFARPQAEPSDYDIAQGWAKKRVTVLPNGKKRKRFSWKGLDAIFQAYTDDVKEMLERQIEKRREDVRAVREGSAKFPIRSLGITVVKFNVKEVKVEGAVAKAAELEEKEKKERAADEVEIQNVSDRIRQLLADIPNLTVQQAIDIVQTERDKVARTIIAVNGAQTAVGSDLLGLAGIAKQVVEALRGGNSGQSGQNNPQGGGNPITGFDPTGAKAQFGKPFSHMTKAEQDEYLRVHNIQRRTK
jgi:hypothetical protein